MGRQACLVVALLVAWAGCVACATIPPGGSIMELGEDNSGVMVGAPDNAGEVDPSPSPSSTPYVVTHVKRLSQEEKQQALAGLLSKENRGAVTGRHRDPKSYSQAEIAGKITILIKTFERESCLLKFLHSIRQYYPTVPILVADDSKQVANTSILVTGMENVLYFPLPFDTGVSAGRNFVLDHVKTPFFLVSDDDNVFTANTTLENLLADIESSGADIVGACNGEGDNDCIGDWDMFHKDRMIDPQRPDQPPTFSTLQVREVSHAFMQPVEQRPETVDVHSPFCKDSDMVANFFLARTAFVSGKLRWDPFFKVGEHEDFFYRAKQAEASVRFCTNVQVDHEHLTCLQTVEQHSRYRSFRSRAHSFLDGFFRKFPHITRLETPWTTIEWVCACNDPMFASGHLKECDNMNQFNRTDCHSKWDTNHVTKAVPPVDPMMRSFIALQTPPAMTAVPVSEAIALMKRRTPNSTTP